MIAPTLTLACLADAPGIAAMSQRLIERGLRPSWGAQRVAGHIASRDSNVLTAVLNGELIAFAIMQYGDEAAHLNLLAVEPTVRRVGVGRRLIEWLEATALIAGTFSIDLELRAGNTEARTFYAALGYRETGRLDGYYQRIEDAIRMSRDLRIGRNASQPRG